MYYIAKNNIITMNRGDFFQFPVCTYMGQFPEREVLMLDEGDYLYFALMEPNQPFEKAILKKEYTKDCQDSEGNALITLLPEDTIGLAPGTYYYQIKVLYKIVDDQDIRIDTVIQKTKFIILD